MSASVYYNLAENFYSILLPKENLNTKLLSKEPIVYKAEDGSIIFSKENLPELELHDSMESNIIFFSDRVVKPYIKLPKYYTINYTRLFRYTIYLAFYLSKKKRDKKYTYFLLEKDIKELSEKLLNLFRDLYFKHQEIVELAEFDPAHQIVEKSLIYQIMPFVLLFARPDIISFFHHDNSREEFEKIISKEYDIKKLGKIIDKGISILSDAYNIISADAGLDGTLERYSFVNYKHQGEIIKLQAIPRAFQLLASILRLYYFLKQSLGEKYQEFVYKAAFCAFVSVYNPFFHKIKYINERKKEKMHLQIPDLGNLFLFRLINIFLSYLKDRKLIIEILGGRDLHLFSIAEDEDVKSIYKFLPVNPILPFDTRAIELLQQGKILKLSESYLRLYSMENELLRVHLYKNYLQEFFNLKVVARRIEYNIEPRKMLSDVMFYEKISLRCASNKSHYDTVFSKKSDDITNYKKLADKRNIILSEGRFSDFKNLGSFRKIKNYDHIYEYFFEPVEDNNIPETKEEIVITKVEKEENNEIKSQKRTRKQQREKIPTVHFSSFDVKNYLVKQVETNKILKKVGINFSRFFNIMEGESAMDEKEFENLDMDQIDENVYNDILGALSSNDENSNIDPLEKLLVLKEEENSLLRELNNKLEKLLELVRKQQSI